MNLLLTVGGRPGGMATGSTVAGGDQPTRGRNMDLELATLRDISEELLRRKTSFCLIAKEPTNRRERSRLWVSGEGIRRRDLMCLARFTDRMFARKDARKNRPTDSDTE